jgi:NAD(P) transhydrogenase
VGELRASLALGGSILRRVPSFLQTTDKGVKVFFNSGKVLSADALLYTVGRQASTDGLNLEAVGLSRNHRGLINVNKNYQTDQPHM